MRFTKVLFIPPISNSTKNSTEFTKTHSVPVSIDLGADHNTSKVSNFRYNLRETKDTTTYHIPTKSLTSVEEDTFDTTDSEEKQFQQMKVVKNGSWKIEVEPFFHTPSVNVALDKKDCEVHTQNVKCIQLSPSLSYQSAVHNQLKVKVASPSVDPDQDSYAVNLSDKDTSSNILDGKTINMCISYIASYYLAVVYCK